MLPKSRPSKSTQKIKNEASKWNITLFLCSDGNKKHPSGNFPFPPYKAIGHSSIQPRDDSLPLRPHPESLPGTPKSQGGDIEPKYSRFGNTPSRFCRRCMPLALHTAPDTTPVGQAPFNGQFPLSTGSPPFRPSWNRTFRTSQEERHVPDKHVGSRPNYRSGSVHAGAGSNGHNGCGRG